MTTRKKKPKKQTFEEFAAETINELQSLSNELATKPLSDEIKMAVFRGFLLNIGGYED